MRCVPFPESNKYKSRQRNVRLYVEKEVTGLKSALSGQVDSAYQQGADFLRKRLNLENPSVLARTLDVAMNPDSLFVSFRDKKRSKNANARRLSVEEDMEPVVAFLEGQGLSVRQVAAVVTEHPPVLSYSIPDRLSPLMTYLDTVGVQDVPKVIATRPSILGLETENIRLIVDYLQANEYTPEQVSEYLSTTI